MTMKITGTYIGQKKVTLLHEDSGAAITTSAPKDNQGDGTLFSPTDLVASALGSCMMTVIAIVAERNNLPLDGLKMEVEKEMKVHEGKRMIASMPVRITMSAGLSQLDRQKLEAAALSCPVKHSLHPDVNCPVEFIYE